MGKTFRGDTTKGKGKVRSSGSLGGSYKEVNVVGAVDRGGHAVDGVGDGDAAAELGVVFDVVDEQRGVVELRDDGLDLRDGVLCRGSRE